MLYSYVYFVCYNIFIFILYLFLISVIKDILGIKIILYSITMSTYLYNFYNDHFLGKH